MSDNKLKIRINLQQTSISGGNDQGDQDVLEEKSFPQHSNVLEEPPFDWRKIAIALTAFAVLAGMTGYLLVGNDKTPDTGSSGVSHSGTGDVADYPAGFSAFDDHQSALLLPKEQPESPPDTQETIKPATDNAPVGNRQQQNVGATEIVPVPRMKPLRLGSTKMLTPPKPVIKPAAAEADGKPGSRPDFAPLPDEYDAAGISSATETMESVADHSGVIRAQLTHQIRQREPVGETDRVLLGDSGSSSIYFFIELSGFDGRQLTVDWYFEDRLMTETKLHVGARKWRTNAKKLLRKRDAGVWRVMLRDQAGHPLAERRFVVEA
ncbi:MAG: DUF2914 domain-containing protein [Nitrosomonas sp.]|nr:DUF2914 domain-containing protein [Nitrosomonas sp.]